MDIEYLRSHRQVGGMKKALVIFATAMALTLGTAADARCYADYKAKRADPPLRLHYGVIEVFGPCKKKVARREARARLEANGWVLLKVVSVFRQKGLAKRRDSAGKFYLRY